jgi:hypothetical protein
VSQCIIAQLPYASIAKSVGFLLNCDSIFTPFLRHLYNFHPTVWHTPQRQGGRHHRVVLLLPQARQAHGGPQLQGSSLLVASHSEGLLATGLGFFLCLLPFVSLPQQEFSLDLQEAKALLEGLGSGTIISHVGVRSQPALAYLLPAAAPWPQFPPPALRGAGTSTAR